MKTILADPSSSGRWERFDATIDRLFRETAQLEPESVALVDGESELTYRQLDEITDCLAATISTRAQPSTIVGVHIRKSALYVIATLATLKAGRSYVHLDENYQTEFIGHILRENDVDLILTDALLSKNLMAGDSQILDIETETEWRISADQNHSLGAASAEAIAIIGYTSGTTGLPKGVAVSHRACVYAFCKFWEEVKHLECHRFGYATYLAWDALSPLIFGATAIVLPGQADEGLEELVAEVKLRRVNHLFLTPTLLGRLADLPELDDRLLSVAVVWIGGEVVRAEHARLARRIFQRAELFNNYGPTECFVVSQGQIPHSDDALAGPIPAGSILPELSYLLVRADGRPDPNSREGYLSVGGPALAQGYINQPELNSRSFVQISGKTYYVTGDYCRRMNDDRLLILGRSEMGVGEKETGLREIQIRLDAHAEVRDSAVVRSPNSNEVLVFYITSTAGFALDVARDLDVHDGSVRAIRLDTIPLNPVSQKLDYAQLYETARANCKSLPIGCG